MTGLRALAALALVIPLSASDLASRLDAILSEPPLARAYAGMEVVRLSDGKVLFAHNAGRLFTPASNMKLFTTALALEKLGPDYRLKTQICASAPMDAAGVLAGDLDLIGGGDPSMSGRVYPYSKTPSHVAYTFAAIDELADQLVARGLRRVDGDIVGDDTRYVWEPQPGPWSSEDATQEYGAPVSALIVDDNSFELTVKPGAHAGDLARIQLTPPFEDFAIDNRVMTTAGAERKIEFYRSASGRELHVWGKIPKRDAGFSQALAVGDPALHAAEVLREALERRGVVVQGRALARHLFPDEARQGPKDAVPWAGVVLAERESPRLLDLLQVVDKVSQNLHAEVLLREVAVAAGQPGSRDAGLKIMDAFLTSIGISEGDHQFTDGSGLARATLVSPGAIVKLLAYMERSKYREQWVALLPIGGEDGTLETRFAGHPEAHAIHAKTGTLDHVRALSGYADTPHGRVAFSILANNFEEPSGPVREAIDRLALALLE